MPIKSRSALAFFIRVTSYVSPTPYLSCFVIFTISRSSNLAVGSRLRIAKPTRGNAARRSDFRVFECTTDNLFVARNRQEQRKKRGPFAPSRRTGLPSSCGNLTRPRDESALRRECAPSLLASPLLTAGISSFFLLSIGQRTGAKLLARAKQLVAEDEEFFRLFETYPQLYEIFELDNAFSQTNISQCDNEVSNY